MERLSLPFKKIHPDAKPPNYSHGSKEDAGMDLYAVQEAVIPPGEWLAVPTGIAIALPPGYEGQVRPRSGLARKHGVTLLNSPGTVDPGYRGELQVILVNHGSEPFTVRRGDRIAQLIIGRYAAIEWKLEEDLPESVRGDGGFGSTGT